ncbi:MAG: peptidoglycan recognition family protein [Candidatus Paceibacterota bacterium]
MKIINKCLTKDQFEQYIKDKKVDREIDKIVLHHTYDTLKEWEQGKISPDYYKKFYEEKGWEVGPHLFVAPEGIWLFTDISMTGRHANEGNSNSIGIEMVGRYNDESPSGKIWKNTKAILKNLLKKFDLSLQDVHFHREYNSGKDCPGKAVTRKWLKKELS